MNNSMMQATLLAQMRQKIMDSLRAELKKFSQAKRQAKYLYLVKKNKNWKYPQHVPDPRELESWHAWRVINKLKEVTIKMRRGEYLTLNVDRGEFSDYNGEVNEEMMPHLKEFADALLEYRHTIDYMEDETFSISLDCSVPNEVLDLLQDALQRTHFHHLSFYCYYIDELGFDELGLGLTLTLTHINFIANCITADTRLKNLTLDALTLENTRDIDELCAAVNSRQSLKQLIMDDCHVGVGNLREIFSKLKSPTLESMELTDDTGTGISNLLPGDISDLLSSNPSLRILDLRGNPFNGQDIVYMADALRNNTSLRELRLGLNDHDVFPDKWHPLASVVYDQTSLNLAYDSNHHCHIHLDISRSEIIFHPIISKFNKYEDPIMNRRKKIYHILSTRNRNRENAAYFESDNIGIMHMPRILALLEPFSEHYLDDKEGKEDDEVEPLSIAYELLRDWKMPELYNYLDVMEED